MHQGNSLSWKPELHNGFEQSLVVWHAARLHDTCTQLGHIMQASAGCKTPSISLEAMQARLSLASVPF